MILDFDPLTWICKFRGSLFNQSYTLQYQFPSKSILFAFNFDILNFLTLCGTNFSLLNIYWKSGTWRVLELLITNVNESEIENGASNKVEQ